MSLYWRITVREDSPIGILKGSHWPRPVQCENRTQYSGRFVPVLVLRGVDQFGQYFSVQVGQAAPGPLNPILQCTPLLTRIAFGSVSDLISQSVQCLSNFKHVYMPWYTPAHHLISRF